MKNGICPKCQSSEVYSQPGSPHQKEMVTLKAAVFGRVAFPDRYVCVDCGYIETYLTTAEDLDRIREEWTRVPRR